MEAHYGLSMDHIPQNVPTADLQYEPAVNPFQLNNLVQLSHQQPTNGQQPFDLLPPQIFHGQYPNQATQVPVL